MRGDGFDIKLSPFLVTGGIMKIIVSLFVILIFLSACGGLNDRDN